MALFPMSCVLRGFSAGLSRYSGATYAMYASTETLVRLVEHINLKNQDVKSRHLAGLIKKTAHFQIGNQLVLSFKTISFSDGQ